VNAVPPVIFSGIQPTGRKHLGNYIGAIRQYVTGQDRGDPAIYCIVDLHATTLPYDPAELRERVYDTTAILLAAGLDPERCILFRQGDVQEHSELCWLLTPVTANGELQRMHQFRDKSPGQRELASAGLLLYPVLQAADVLAYRAHEVPVGEDQREHLELMRNIAKRFNARFPLRRATGDGPSGEDPGTGGDDILVVPDHRIPAVGARVRDLQEPARKMSTTGGTEQGTVLVLDEPDTIRRKFKRAVTDSDDPPVLRRGDDKPGVSNLIDILAVMRGTTPEAIEDEMVGARGYGDLKVAVGDAVVAELAPLQERYHAIRADADALEAVLAAGAAKARAIASVTLADVREAMGIGPARSHNG
jgi:tryptophanyl-tRNA synthetase